MLGAKATNNMTPEYERNLFEALYPHYRPENKFMNITVPCPICSNDLSIEVSLTLETDGDPDTPYTQSYYAIDDYTIDWETHDTIYNLTPRCQTLALDLPPAQQDKFEQLIADKAAQEPGYEPTVYN